MVKKPKKKKKNMPKGTDPHAHTLAGVEPGLQTPVQTTATAGGHSNPADDAAGVPEFDVGTVRTLDQRRAEFALNKVEDTAGESFAGKYRAYARNLPTAIIANGLGQAVAMELAQSQRGDGSEGHGRLLDHLTAWLVDGWGDTSPYHGAVQPDRYRTTDLIKQIVEKSDAELARAQIEAMAFLKWLKTFAEALIEPEDESDASTDNDGTASAGDAS